MACARKAAKPRRRRPVEPPIRDPGRILPVDSEDEAGTYAPGSPHDTGESDEGVLAQGPLPPSGRPKQARGGGAMRLKMRPKKKRTGPEERPDPIKDELPETVGGTNGELDAGAEAPPPGLEEGAYGRPQEQGADDELI